jgi:hypothetical protein
MKRELSIAEKNAWARLHHDITMSTPGDAPFELESLLDIAQHEGFMLTDEYSQWVDQPKLPAIEQMEEAIGNQPLPYLKLKEAVEHWMKFAEDVVPGDAAGRDWLNGLRARSKALLSDTDHLKEQKQ